MDPELMSTWGIMVRTTHITSQCHQSVRTLSDLTIDLTINKYKGLLGDVMTLPSATRSAFLVQIYL